MQQHADVVTDLKGNVIRAAQVRVLLLDGTLATIYAANGGAPTVNPLVSGARGEFAFYAPNGDYTLEISVEGRVFGTLGPIKLYDALEDADRASWSSLAADDGASRVTFTQAGAGSVPMPVQDKLRELSISIADKGGAVDILDNSAALLNAVNAGRSVYVPDGEWKVTSATDLPDHAYVWGPGKIYRTNAGPIFTATGKQDITIQCGLKGDLNSWALMFSNCQRIRVAHCRVEEIMLLQTDSATSAYATTTAANMCRDIMVYGNAGICTGTPNAISQQFIRLLYPRDFSVIGNTARGYRDFILAWGGDFATSGAIANERKCYNGLIEGNRATVLAAGIWTAMADNVLITGNKLYGNAFAEGLDAEGSTNITFNGNEAINFADGLTLFGINQNIRFRGNTITATANALRNASSTFAADYGLVELADNSFRAIGAACIGWVTGALGRLHMRGNRFDNVAITMTDAYAAEIVFNDNKLYYDYVPAALWMVRLGGLATGYTSQPKKSQILAKRNRIEWRGTGVAAKRAFGLSSSAVAHLVDLQQNEFIGIDEQISLEGSTGAMAAMIKRNIFDAAATYPLVLHGSSTGLTVIWQDNDRSDGMDAYGTNTPAAAFFSSGSRIWSNTPANGAAPGWIYRSGVWGPMAAIG